MGKKVDQNECFMESGRGPNFPSFPGGGGPGIGDPFTPNKTGRFTFPMVFRHNHSIQNITAFIIGMVKVVYESDLKILLF